MKSLSSNYLNPITDSWTEFKSIAKELLASNSEGKKTFPVEIEGLHGASTSFFTANYIEEIRNKILSDLQYNATGRYSQSQQKDGLPSSATSMDTAIVVSSEKEANEIKDDFTTAFDDNVEISILPWWGIVPYRAASPSSAVFGQRAGVLAKMAVRERVLTAQTKPRIFIINQRSLQTPVPSPEYMRSVIFTLKKGQQIDPSELSETLSYLGYIRVPKVGVPGEFTLRGEVLDIFTPEDSLPTRVNFDFDEIGQIWRRRKRWQGGSGPWRAHLIQKLNPRPT